MKRTHFLPYSPALLSALALLACAPLQLDAQTSSVGAHPLAAKQGQSVQLVGTYAGWAACPASGAKTRSDWVLQYTDALGAQCVFVTGGLPQGISPPPATTSVGLPTSIEGIVELNSQGKPFVQFVK